MSKKSAKTPLPKEKLRLRATQVVMAAIEYLRESCPGEVDILIDHTSIHTLSYCMKGPSAAMLNEKLAAYLRAHHIICSAASATLSVHGKSLANYSLYIDIEQDGLLRHIETIASQAEIKDRLSLTNNHLNAPATLMLR